MSYDRSTLRTRKSSDSSYAFSGSGGSGESWRCLREGGRPAENANSLSLFINFKDQGSKGGGSQGESRPRGCQLLEIATSPAINLYFEGRAGGVRWSPEGASGRASPFENAKSLARLYILKGRGGQGSLRGASGRGVDPSAISFLTFG